MKCNEASRKLDSYVDGELCEIEEFQIKKHISNCAKCMMEHDEINEIFDALSCHEMDMTPLDFTDNVLSQISMYERDKDIKHVFLFKGVASIVAAGMVVTVFNAVQYNPITLFSQIYKSSDKINRIIVDPVDRFSRDIKEIANSF